MEQVKKILFVDDDAEDQFLFREAINTINPSLYCEIALNGLEALKRIETPPPPDLIFLDLNMPIMNGYECLTELKKKDSYQNIPVVIFTTSHDSRDIERSQKMGANLFFTKPSNFATYIDKLKTILPLDFPNLPFDF